MWIRNMRLAAAVGFVAFAATTARAEDEPTTVEWKAKADYVLAGDVDSDSLSEQASTTNFAAGLALKKPIGNDWLIKGEAGLGIADDYLDDSQDTWSWIGSAQVGRDENKHGFAPYAKWTLKVNYADFSRGYVRSDNTFSGGANFTHRGALACAPEGGCGDYWVRFTPEVAVVVSDKDNKDQWTWKLAISGERPAPLMHPKVLLHAYANYYQGKYDHVIDPMVVRRKDKGLQAFAGLELKEWIKGRWKAASVISEAKLGVRYVWQKSNSLTATDSYSRLQVLPTLALKGTF